MSLKKWEIKSLDKEKSATIAEEYQIPTVLAMLLSQRCSDDEIDNFLYEGSFAESPFDITDMDKATERLRLALDNSEKIAIYGDYDADGVTSTAILYDYLKTLSADVIFYIPEREGEGYGMNADAIKKLHAENVSLIITVDNGISSVDEVNLANELNIDVVIIDHHRPSEILPNAVAIVDPYRVDCTSYFKAYCAAGLVFKFLLAMEFDYGDEDEILHRYSDLACIGTIADIVPLSGENRVIVRNGLKNISKSERVGIIALLEKSMIEKPSSTAVAFTLAPRINASGRMGSARQAVEMLVCDNRERALLIAENICSANDDRKEIEAQIIKEAITKIESDNKIKYARVIVVDNENWHPGVIGIVASRIVEKYGKPAIIISVDEHGVGSGRSIGDFSLFDAITHCKDLLIRFGGHKAAAGLSVAKENIPKFREKINEFALNYYETMPVSTLEIDLKLQPRALSVDIAQQISLLEPFGSGNKSPVFGIYLVKLEKVTALGAMKNHLRLNFSRDDVKIECMLFSCTLDEFPYAEGDLLDLAVSLDAREFRGVNSLTTIVRHIKPSSVDIDVQISSYKGFEKFMRNESLTDNEFHLIDISREDLVLIYKYIKQKNKFALLQVPSTLNNINVGKLMLGLKALEESQLIELNIESLIEVKIVPTDKKVDIMNSNIIKRLKGSKKGDNLG